MNRLLTFEGRQPIWLDDLDFLQNSFSDEIKKLVEGLLDGETFAVLTGCVLSNGNYTSGIVYYNGEIYAVPAGTVAGNPRNSVCFSVVESYDQNGDREMEDSGIQESCYQIRTGKFIYGTSGLTPNRRLEKILSNRINLVEKLYDADQRSDESDGHICLLRCNGSYTLDGSFSGVMTLAVPQLFDAKAARDLFSASGGSRYWVNNETIGTCAYRYLDGETIRYSTCPVSVVVSGINENSIRIQAFLLGNIPQSAEGGFSIHLNTTK